MSEKEAKRLEVMVLISKKGLSQTIAAQHLGLSIRQIKRLYRNYKKQGPSGLISKHRGKASNNKLSSSVHDAIRGLIQDHYQDFGPSFAREKLEEVHQIKIGKETLRQLMIKWGYWKAKRSKANKISHALRMRRPCFGELIQTDGSDHDWFEGRRDKCCLIVCVDDATGKLTALHFAEVESTKAYFEAFKQHLLHYGKPAAIYSDRHSIFKINLPSAASGSNQSQFQRAMSELGIETITANTPQAKGRVERANKTLQDRLTKELRLRGISSIQEANAYLHQFIKAHNQKFAVAPIKQADAHHPLALTPGELDLILCHKFERTISRNLSIQFNNNIYQIQGQGKGYRLQQAKVTVCELTNGRTILLYKNKVLAYKTIDQSLRRSSHESSKTLNRRIDQILKNRLTQEFILNRIYPQGPRGLSEFIDDSTGLCTCG